MSFNIVMKHDNTLTHFNRLIRLADKGMQMKRTFLSATVFNTPRRLLAAALIAGTMVTTAACTPVKATRGNMVEDSRLEELIPGVTTKSNVAHVLGTPTTVATFDQNTWYYIGEKTEQHGLAKTEVKERRILIVSFDEKGYLKQIEEKNANDAKEIDPVDRATPTAGREFTIYEQLIGNVGKFNPAGGSPSGAPGGGP